MHRFEANYLSSLRQGLSVVVVVVVWMKCRDSRVVGSLRDWKRWLRVFRFFKLQEFRNCWSRGSRLFHLTLSPTTGRRFIQDSGVPWFQTRWLHQHSNLDRSKMFFTSVGKKNLSKKFETEDGLSWRSASGTDLISEGWPKHIFFKLKSKLRLLQIKK